MYMNNTCRSEKLSRTNIFVFIVLTINTTHELETWNKMREASNDAHSFQWKYNSQEIFETEIERNQKSSLAIYIKYQYKVNLFSVFLFIVRPPITNQQTISKWNRIKNSEQSPLWNVLVHQQKWFSKIWLWKLDQYKW